MNATGTITRVLVLSLLLLFTLPACVAERTDEGAGGPSPEQESAAPVVAAEDTTLFWIDDYAVTEAELERFAARFFPSQGTGHGGSGHGSFAGFNPFELIKPYLRYYSLVREAERRGLDAEAQFQTVLDMSEAHELGKLYRRHIIDNYVIPESLLLSKIPEDWTRMNFRLYVFNSDDAAWAAHRKALENPDRMEAVLDELAEPSARGNRPQTNTVLKGSGFFDPFDDVHLFSLEEGDISQPVHSGLGLAIAYVIERSEYTQTEKNAHLTRIRAGLNQSLGGRKVDEIIDRIGASSDLEKLEPVFWEDMRTRQWPDVVVGRLGDRPITYRQLRWLVTPRAQFYIRAYGEDRAAWYVNSDFTAYLRNCALGMASREDESFSPPEIFDTLRRDNRWDLLHRMVQQRLYDELDTAVTTQEARQFYDSNPSRFTRPATVRMLSYFTPVKETIETMWQRHEEGVGFNKLADGLRSPSGAPHGSSGLQMRERRIEKGSDALAPLQETLFRLEPGDVRVLDIDTGYYLVRVEEKVAEQSRTFEMVREEIIDGLGRTRKSEAVSQKIQELEEQYQVRLSDDLPPAGEPSRIRDLG